MGRNLGWNEKARTEVIEVMKKFNSGGYGIPKERLHKLFEELRQLRSSGVIGSSSYEKLTSAIAEMYSEPVEEIDEAA